MKTITKFIETINNDGPHIEETFLFCAEMFEKTKPLDVHDDSCPQSIIDDLVLSIQSFIERNERLDIAGTAVWVIGKLNRKSLYPYFINLLPRFYEENNNALYQTLIAISNIDSKALDVQSLNIFEHDENKLLASKLMNLYGNA